MRKTSFLLLTACIVSFAGLLWAAYAAHASSTRRRALEVFHKSIDNEINTKYSTGVGQLVDVYGTKDAAKLIDTKAQATDAIAFDGTSRLVKIVQRTKEWTGPDPSETGYSDGVVLECLWHDTGAIWDGPIGTRISSVRFVDGELVVSVHGNLQLGASTRNIPEEVPEDYTVPWPRGSKPTPGSLYDAVVSREQRSG